MTPRSLKEKACIAEGKRQGIDESENREGGHYRREEARLQYLHDRAMKTLYTPCFALLQ